MQDAGQAAVVGLELKDGGAGVAIGETDDVAEIRAAPRVDALEVVAHHQQVAMVGGQRVHPGGLDHVGVLVLVHQDVLEAFAVVLKNVRVLTQQAQAIDEQVVEIHGVQVAFFLRIQGGHAGHVVHVDLMPVEALVGDLQHRHLAAVGQAEHGQQHVRLGKMFAHQVQFVSRGANQAAGVVLIEDGVVVAVAQRGGVAAQHAVGHVVGKVPPHSPPTWSPTRAWARSSIS